MDFNIIGRNFVMTLGLLVGASWAAVICLEIFRVRKATEKKTSKKSANPRNKFLANRYLPYLALALASLALAQLAGILPA